MNSSGLQTSRTEESTMNEDVLQSARSPLIVIKGFIHTLSTDTAYTNEQRQEFHTIIDRECDRLSDALNAIAETCTADTEQELAARRADLETLALELADRDQAMKILEADLSAKHEAIQELHALAEDQLAKAQVAIETAAGLTSENARAQVLAEAEADARGEAAKRAKAIQEEAIADAERKGKQILLTSMQRLATEYTIETSSAVIQLPSEDMKGKLIGREGRNIRTFEQVAGVDLIIDESPETVVVSSFDPVRREIARLTLMNMMLDGRIHPARIEELHEKAKQEIEKVVRESGEEAADRAKVAGISKGVLQTLGRLRFRSSYAQNVLDHSVEVAELCALLAHELGFNVEIARRAGLLHDIGKALGPEWEGPHAIAGMNYLKDQGETDAVALAVGAHHFEIEPASSEAQIVIIADGISASRPGSRRETLDLYIKRVAQLEGIANAFPGVERSYAIQAGREIRLVVRPDQVSDGQAEKLAAEVAKKIETELQYPGQIKVTVIRELRVQRLAK
jgi:ribonuclease Y